MSKQVTNYGFADIAVEGRKIQSVFLKQMEAFINWGKLETIINKHYTLGLSEGGRPAVPGLILFKMLLLQTWYKLSDYEVEEKINDTISYSRFVGISLSNNAPDHSLLSKFRSHLTKNKVFDMLFEELNRQLEAQNIIVKTGVIVDASITDSPRKPRGKKAYEVVESSKKEGTSTLVSEQSEQIEKLNTLVLQESKQSHVDQEGKWTIKNQKPRFGYKKHYVTDDNGIVLGVVTTPANVNEISNLAEVLDTVKLAPGTKVKGDKGYKSQKNDALLQEKALRNHILLKGQRNSPIVGWGIVYNKLISKVRYKIERTFGSIKRWFNGGKTRYLGKEKTHTQHLIEAMCYNLYRSPNLYILNLSKTDQ